MHTKFHSRFLFYWMVRKAWGYEKSVPGAQVAPTAWGILQLVVSFNVARDFFFYLITYLNSSKNAWVWTEPSICQPKLEK